jgi:amidase
MAVAGSKLSTTYGDEPLAVMAMPHGFEIAYKGGHRQYHVPPSPRRAMTMGTSVGLDYCTTKELVGLLASRQISAVELFARAVARIEARDKQINAVVVRDFERAREAAKAADARLARGESGALLGVPMTVKEAFNVAGLPTTWGFAACKDFRPTEDALAITRLKAAGAVILGKTNVPISLADWQSYNDIYGTTNNPWDLTRTPGGSSGGSAASLAAGYVSLELGSDIGGSLRTPAHYCGVYAHKPSLGLAPARGHTLPNLPALAVESDLAVIGPMARSAGDLALGLDVIAGPDEQANAIAYRLALPPPRHQHLKSFRILVIDAHPLIPTAASVRGALETLTERLGKAGAKIMRAGSLLPDLADAAKVYTRLLSSVFAALLPFEQYLRVEAAAKALAPDDDSLAAWRTRGSVMSHRDWIAMDGARARLRRQWRELFREWDVVLCPPMPTTAFPHDHNPEQKSRRIAIDGKLYPYLDQIVWPGIATLVGLPATAAPIALCDAGLPIGVQIIGPYLEDRTTICFADLVAREFGGFVAPAHGKD